MRFVLMIFAGVILLINSPNLRRGFKIMLAVMLVLSFLDTLRVIDLIRS